MKLDDIELLTTTTESPIVSATAVAPVRSGLDSSESAASRPPVGRSRRTGTPSQRTTGRMMNGAAAAMPANIAIVIRIPKHLGDSAACRGRIHVQHRAAGECGL